MEKLIIVQVIKNFTAFYEPKRSLPYYKSKGFYTPMLLLIEDVNRVTS